MATVNSNSLAAATTSSVRNEAFSEGARVLPRKVLIIATGDPAKEASLTLNTPFLVTSPEEAGSKTGFGFMAHRLTEQAFQGHGGAVPTYLSIQAEDAGTGVAATGSVNFAGSTGVLAGTLAFYPGGILNRPVNIAVADGDTPDGLATKFAAAINAVKEIPITAAVNGTTPSIVDITSKSVGAWGNDITLEFNLLAGDVKPTGVTFAVVDMNGGVAAIDITLALNGLGVGDNANADFYTDAVHGYGYVTAVLNDILDYVGAGNAKVGLWSELVHRPMRFLSVDTTPGTAGLNALIAIGDGRREDRASELAAAPTSRTHPQEIAAQTIGYMARVNNEIAQGFYTDAKLKNIDPGTATDRWTDTYTNRDLAVKAGIGTTQVKNGVLTLQDMITFYHPESVAQENNGFRDMENISILQNILDSQYKRYTSEKWTAINLYQDKAQVSDPAAAKKARDINDVITENIRLVTEWLRLGWIFETDFAINQMRINPPTLRVGGNGFDNNIKVILAGKGKIKTTETAFDVSIAVTL